MGEKPAALLICWPFWLLGVFVKFCHFCDITCVSKKKKKTARDLATGMSVSIMLSNVVLPICIQAFSNYAIFFFTIFVLIKKNKITDWKCKSRKEKSTGFWNNNIQVFNFLISCNMLWLILKFSIAIFLQLFFLVPSEHQITFITNT